MSKKDHNIKMRFKKYTVFAITSFVIGVMTISFNFIFLSMDLAATVNAEKGEIILHAPIITTTITLILSLFGLILGIIALIKKTEKISMAMVGVIIHGFFLGLFIF